MKRIALLSCKDLSEFVCDDALLLEPLSAIGWKAEFVAWDTTGVQWNQYEAVIIRATWDYTQRLGEFLSVLNEIEMAGVPLYNSAEIAAWNSRKTYLLDLEKKGVTVVPTQILKSVDEPTSLRGYLNFWTISPEIIFKPTVSANAYNTFRVSSENFETLEPIIRIALKGIETMVQPFVPSVLERGEFSLHFFDGEFSHAIQKVPKKGDFRVQEEHGGVILPMGPAPDLLRSAQKVINAIPESCLYARVDLVELGDQNWALMEVELIEPSLYLRTDAQAPFRFARAFAAMARKNHGQITVEKPTRQQLSEAIQ
jgi:glutathione synthase/RimK-type ligase-like ATP-grasp enzyme